MKRNNSARRQMRTEELDYDLPAELIAQRPPERREASRPLVYRRATGALRHGASRTFRRSSTENWSWSTTRVSSCAAAAATPGGGEAEVLLLERLDDDVWEALARPSRRLRAGQRLGRVEPSRYSARAAGACAWRASPTARPRCRCISTNRSTILARYQTVYADEAGSAAAPTAGLHFTPELLAQARRRARHTARRPRHLPSATTDTVEAHPLHGERYRVAPPAWRRISAAERVLAVGTTTVRVLEIVVRTAELAGRTTFVTPPFEFRRVDALLTNFHLPRSTLLALVMAFAGVEETRELYRLAVAERYRFYLLGDAMLIL